MCSVVQYICVYIGFYVRQRSNNVRLRVLVHVDYDDRYIVEVLDNILGSCARPNNNHVYNNNKKSFSFMYVRMTCNLGSFLKHCACMFGNLFSLTLISMLSTLSLSLTLCFTAYTIYCLKLLLPLAIFGCNLVYANIRALLLFNI